MFTDDVIGDADARLPPRPRELTEEAPAKSTSASRIDALMAMRVGQHEDKIRQLEARLSKLEAGHKRVTTVEDLVKEIPNMAPEQLAQLIASLDRQLDDISSARSLAAARLALKRSDTSEN